MAAMARSRPPISGSRAWPSAQVPVRDGGLLVEGVAAAAVGVVADVAGVEGVHELEGPVVDGQAQDAHVVGVHHPVHEAHRLPLGEQACRALGHLAQQRGVRVGGRAARG
jgi:hypothetical protein